MCKKVSINEFLSDDLLIVPKRRDVKYYMLDEYIEYIFGKYLILIKNLDLSNSVAMSIHRNIGLIEKLCKGICRSLYLYLREGHPAKSYSTFHETMEQVNPGLLFHYGRKYIESNRNMRLFRMRISDVDLNHRKEIFHIPFDMRHTICSQRYSIPGVPCLYLSGSVLCCWEEMGRPPFHKAYVSRFETPMVVDSSSSRWDAIAIMDMAYDPEDVLKEKKDSQIEAFAILWPLIAACSVIKSHDKSAFSQEYIIPQNLMTWVKESTGLDGIAYYSTKKQVAFPPESQHALKNFAFPAKDISGSGFCKSLNGLFKMTYPRQFDLILAGADRVPKRKYNDFSLPIISLGQSYRNTQFGVLEDWLHDEISFPLDMVISPQQSTNTQSESVGDGPREGEAAEAGTRGGKGSVKKE